MNKRWAVKKAYGIPYWEILVLAESGIDAVQLAAARYYEKFHDNSLFGGQAFKEPTKFLVTEITKTDGITVIPSLCYQATRDEARRKNREERNEVDSSRE